MLIMSRFLRLAGLLVVLSSSHFADAQGQQSSRSSLATAAVTNTDFWPNPFPPAIILAGGSSPTGLPLLAELAPTSFSGLNGANSQQTMTFMGTAYAHSVFGILRVSAGGQVANTFYNVNNPPYYRPDNQELNPDGVPDQLAITAQARFEDWLNFSGFSGPFYVSYRFRITGNTSGNIERPRLFFQFAGNPFEVWYGPTGTHGAFADIFATQRYLVQPNIPRAMSVTALVRLEVNTQDWTDGSTVSGSANLGNTVVIEEIIVTDEEGNVATGWTLESESGTNYLALTNRIFGDRFEGTADEPDSSENAAIWTEQSQDELGRFILSSEGYAH